MLHHGTRFAARARRRYFSAESTERQPEIRLRSQASTLCGTGVIIGIKSKLR